MHRWSSIIIIIIMLLAGGHVGIPQQLNVGDPLCIRLSFSFIRPASQNKNLMLCVHVVPILSFIHFKEVASRDR